MHLVEKSRLGVCDQVYFYLLQFSSVTQSCPTLCDPMNHSMPSLPVHHQLPEFTQTHVHRDSSCLISLVAVCAMVELTLDKSYVLFEQEYFESER